MRPGTTVLRPCADFSSGMSENISLRNQLSGTVREIISDKVMSEVIIDTAAGTLSAVITTRSVQSLNLQPGDPVHALIKATNVSVEKP